MLGLLYCLWVVVTIFGIPVLNRTMRTPGDWILTAVWAGLFIVSLPLIGRMMRHFLCSTEWARRQGFTPERLRLFSFASGKVPADPDTVWLQPEPPGGIRSRRARMVLGVGLGLALVFVCGLAWLAIYAGKHHGGSGSDSATGGGSFTKTVVLTRATNTWVGDSQEVQNVEAWTDTTLEPGEALLAMVKRPDGALEEARTLQFVQWQPDGVKTSVALSWFFGKLYTPGFGEGDALTAATQLRERMSDKPLKLTSGKPLEMFTVTNHAGGVLAGYVTYVRFSPKPRELWGLLAAKPQAIVHIRRHTAFLMSVDYSVTLPSGYSIRATANVGQASTHFKPGSTNTEYHSSWFRPYGAGGEYRDYPARREAERKAFEQQFQELLDRGPIPVVLGQPCQMFAVTNKGGDVYRGYLELVAPGGASPTKAPRTHEAHMGQPAEAIEITKPARPRPEALDARPSPPPKYASPASRPLAPVGAGGSRSAARPASVTGLPLPPGVTPGTVSPRVDPTTGLPVPAGVTNSGPRSTADSKPAVADAEKEARK